MTNDCVGNMSLPKLIELKLALGITGGIRRLNDFADKVALIETCSLTAQFADQFNPHVPDNYLARCRASRIPRPSRSKLETAHPSGRCMKGTRGSENEFRLVFGLDITTAKEYNLQEGPTGSETLATGQRTRRTVLDPHLPVDSRQIFP